jgi:SPX domain protein involved in polyphosphate accumulation
MKQQLQFQRHELKYYLPEELYSNLIHTIRPYMSLDPHLESKEKKSYLVRSLYLDTDNLRFYHDKISGCCNRKKFRVRAYDQDYSEVFLEIKRKSNNFVIKDRACIHYEELSSILNQYGGYQPNGRGNKAENDVVTRYLSLIPVMQLQPIVLMTYEREAYMGIFDNDARLTLDRNLRCLPGRSNDLFYTGQNWMSVNKPCILELKFNNVMPFFFKNIIKQFNLWASGISKYCLCIEKSMGFLQ